MKLPIAVLSPLGLFVFAGCGGERLPSPDPGTTGIGAGEYEISVTHNARDRSYLIFVPDAARDGSPIPVVVAFHGGGGSARQFRDANGLIDVAAREGFAVVHPEGTGLVGMNTWNVGHCCGRAADLDVDDVGFVLAVLDDLARRMPLDGTRVFATGHSNGAMMSLRLAGAASDRFAGIASVGGAVLPDSGPPPHPVPLLHIHSVDDPRALYGGGLGPPFPLTRRRVQHPPVTEVLARWREVNGCRGEPVLTEERAGEPGTLNDGQRAERLEWTTCRSGAPVVHWRLTGAGHGWPGEAAPRIGERIIGAPTTLVDAAEEAWAFFSSLEPA